MNPAIQALVTVAVGVGGCVLYFWLSNIALDKVFFPAKGPNAGRNITRANMVRPWLFLAPALTLLGLYLAYPVFATFWLSLNKDVNGTSQFVGFANYQQMMSETKFWESMRNNMLWLVVVPAGATAFGLLAAQLTDRLKWGSFAKSLIFMPMAISFVGASVIWKLIYDTRPAGQEQIGILNALYIWFGGDAPQQWLQIPFWNNFFLMAVLIWIQAGFAMVILSAALRGIPEETIEAAILDGAGPFQIFFKIKVPQIMGTIVVVWTTITITVLKVFDIVLAMTNGQWETQVLANFMYDKFFRSFDVGVGSAVAMVIMLLVTPILVWNVYNVRKEMR
jgi:alpha-glucoside transport system permease protein